VARARLYGQALDGSAGGCGRRGETGLAAELGGDAALDIDAVCSAGGGGPVEFDLIADTLGGQVGDQLGQIESGRVRIAGAGAADGEEKVCGETSAKPSAVTGMPLILR